MRKFFLLCCIAFFALPGLAVDSNQVKYVGGTVPGMKVGVTGELQMSGTTLTFESPGHRVAIPYSSIESFDHSTEVARHLGVLPAIVVALLRARQRRHFIGISYRDQASDSLPQVVVLEIPKGMTRTLQRVLETRTPPHLKQPTRPCTSS